MILFYMLRNIILFILSLVLHACILIILVLNDNFSFWEKEKFQTYVHSFYFGCLTFLVINYIVIWLKSMGTLKIIINFCTYKFCKIFLKLFIAF